MSDLTFANLGDKTGEVLGTSAWHEITQDQVNEFAHCTGDNQWIHVDVERAKKESPFGGPVAHGYLTLSRPAMSMVLPVACRWGPRCGSIPSWCPLSARTTASTL